MSFDERRVRDTAEEEVRRNQTDNFGGTWRVVIACWRRKFLVISADCHTTVSVEAELEKYASAGIYVVIRPYQLAAHFHMLSRRFASVLSCDTVVQTLE